MFICTLDPSCYKYRLDTVLEILRVYMRIYKCYMRFIPPALTNQITVFVTTRISVMGLAMVEVVSAAQVCHTCVT